MNKIVEAIRQAKIIRKRPSLNQFTRDTWLDNIIEILKNSHKAFLLTKECLDIVEEIIHEDP